jgi:hypothetical protein
MGVGVGSYMPQWKLRSIAVLGTAFAAALATPWQEARAQTPYQIVWVVIGEASSATDKGSAHAGRQLFMASDLVSKSLANIKIELVEVAPSIIEINVGERLCLTSLDIRALGAERKPVGEAPLSVSVRQDHKQQLALNRSKRDICVRPNEPGEYPMRLTSMLPAKDGTTRGAQIFIRVRDPNEADGTTSADIQ